MMKNKNEKPFFIILTILLAILAVGSIVTFIYACYDANQKGIVFGVTFELIYIGLFFVVQFFAFTMSLKAINNGSFIFSELTHIRNNAKVRSKPAAIIALPVQRPSRPSMRLKAFKIDTPQNTVSMMLQKSFIGQIRK